MSGVSYANHIQISQHLTVLVVLMSLKRNV